MKLLATIAAAALVAGGAMMPAAASAQHREVVRERTVVTHRDGPRYHNRKVCRTEWRHHRKVRVCRTVRHR